MPILSENVMKKLIVRLTVLSAALLVGSSALAQSAQEVTETLKKVFGGNSQFSGKVEIKANVPQVGDIALPFNLAVSDNKIRIDLDLGALNAASLPSDVQNYLPLIKKANLEKISAVLRADKNAAYLISPGLKAYMEQSIPSDGNVNPDDVKVETTELGKETVDGQPTVKKKLVVTAAGQTQEFTVWNATGLKNFPIKVEADILGNKAVVTFKDVKLQQPDAQQFETPKEHTRYDNAEALLAAALEKIGQAQ